MHSYFLAIPMLFLLSTSLFAETLVVKVFDNKGEQGMVFEPFLLKAQVGDTVEFHSDSRGHVTQSVFVPKGANSWVGSPDRPVSTVLNKEGVYIYECIYHGKLGMVGAIVAGNAVNLKLAKRFYSQYREKLIVHQKRTDGIIDSIEE